MFRRLHDVSDSADGQVKFTLDGLSVSARKGDSVAVAMLAAGVQACRTTAVSGSPRGPYCLMGVCFDCLVTINGVGNCQACLLPVEEGMRVERQNGAHRLDTPPTVSSAHA